MNRTERDRPAALAASKASQAAIKRENAQAGHTPGPWLVSPYADGFEVDGPGGICIAQAQQLRPIRQKTDHAERKANARLIAAAPELLEALQGLVAVLDRQLHSPHAAERASPLGRARAAIQKAIGDTP